MAPMAVEGTGQLPIRIQSRSLVKASDPSMESHITSFNNLDLTCNQQLFVACLYPKHPKMRGFDDVIATFKAGLPTLLNHFYPLAGRIITSPNSGLPELHCNNQGAELMVAQVDVSLGSLDYGRVSDSLHRIWLPFPEELPLSVQLMSFSCGGFAVVWGNSHLLNDGYSITMLIRMWSELARSGTVSKNGGVPNFDRSVFRPRDPPSYSAEIADMFTRYEEDNLVNVLTARESFLHRLYYIDASDIARLREMASTKGERASRVQALSAYIWKALAAAVAASSHTLAEEHCRMGWWVNGRQRLTAPELVPAMANYFGNVTTYRLKKVAVEEIQRKRLPEVAAMVRETISAVDYDEYIQQQIDLVEQHKMEPLVEKALFGFGPPTINLTALASFPLDTDFGFGQAALAMPIYLDSRLCTGFLSISPRPGGADGSWFVTAELWPRLAAALESDGHNVFKPLTAEYLGLA